MADISPLQSTQSAFPAATILFFIFLVLKLTGVIHWSWWWVFAPFWLPLVVVGALVVLVFGGAAIGNKIKAVYRKHKNKG